MNEKIAIADSLSTTNSIINMINYSIEQSNNKDFRDTLVSYRNELEDLQKKFKYYRLSLYIYSYASLMEILLLGNYQSEYLLSKKNELDDLYFKEWGTCLKEIKIIKIEIKIDKCPIKMYHIGQHLMS